MLILGIESSCDETAAAVVRDGREILSNVISTQIEEHKKYGGVVPEIASRRHCENIYEVVEKALSDADKTLFEIDAVAVTYAPGLIGALLVGVSFAKGLCAATGKILIPVHHIKGHVCANYLTHKDLKPPYLCLIASGGHTQTVEVSDFTTYKIIGRTRDDAAGEAFDKAARVLGLCYPGGVQIDKLSASGDAYKYPLPTPHVTGSEYDFSFSGLKTAVINTAHNLSQKGIEIDKADMAASFQRVVSEALVQKTMLAAEKKGYTVIAAAGGVSANSGVRNLLQKECDKRGYTLYLPKLSLCGDNGAMIASAGYYEYLSGVRGDMSLNAYATMSMEKLQ